MGNYAAEQMIFSQGDQADAVFYIQKGKVKITVVSELGKEAVVALLGPGRCAKVSLRRTSPRSTAERARSARW